MKIFRFYIVKYSLLETTGRSQYIFVFKYIFYSIDLKKLCNIISIIKYYNIKINIISNIIQ